jgi:serine/threonine protein kinase
MPHTLAVYDHNRQPWASAESQTAYWDLTSIVYNGTSFSLEASEVGRGGYGFVHRLKAQKATASATYAQQALPPLVVKFGIVVTTNELRHLQKEAQVWHTLDHPEVALLAWLPETGDGRYALIMPEIPGENGHELLQTSSRDPRQKLKLIMAMFMALHRLHQKGLLHGDAKPNNCMLTKQSDGSYHGEWVDFYFSCPLGTPVTRAASKCDYFHTDRQPTGYGHANARPDHDYYSLAYLMNKGSDVRLPIPMVNESTAQYELRLQLTIFSHHIKLGATIDGSTDSKISYKKAIAQILGIKEEEVQGTAKDWEKVLATTPFAKRIAAEPVCPVQLFQDVLMKAYSRYQASHNLLHAAYERYMADPQQWTLESLAKLVTRRGRWRTTLHEDSLFNLFIEKVKALPEEQQTLLLGEHKPSLLAQIEDTPCCRFGFFGHDPKKQAREALLDATYRLGAQQA